MQLKKSLRPDFWEDVLTAVIEHDDHLLDFKEKNYLTDIGTPLDFTLDKRSDNDAYEHAERVYRSSCQKSQVVALLVGSHLEFLYGSVAKQQPKFKEFFNQVRRDRKKQIKLIAWNKNKLEAAYDLMRFCDRCSLILCQNLIPQGGRKLEINNTILGNDYFINEDGGNLKIGPWPFETNNFKMQYEYRILKESSFPDNLALEKAIRDAPVQLKEISFRK